jgi:hypothetical protein
VIDELLFSVKHAPDEWKLLLAEVVTDVLVRRLLTRKYPPSIDVDAQSLYADHAEWVTKLLPRLQRSCLAGATSVGEVKGALTRFPL